MDRYVEDDFSSRGIEIVDGFDEPIAPRKTGAVTFKERARVLREESCLGSSMINAEIARIGSSLARLSVKKDHSCIPRSRSEADPLVLAVREGRPKHGLGALTRLELVRAVVDTANHVLHGNLNTPVVAFYAPCQSGKSDYSSALRILLPLWAWPLEHIVHVVMMPFTQLSTSIRNEADADRSRAVYSSICLEGDENMTVQNANDDLFAKDRTVRRSRGRNIEPLIDSLTEQGVTMIVLVIDEADHASGKGSILSKFLDETQEYAKARGAIIRYVLISATPYEFENGALCHPVEMLPGEGYRGICHGRQINIRTFTSVASHMGIRRLSAPIDMKHGGESAIPDVARMLLRLVKGYKAEELGLNGRPLNGGQGMVVRYGQMFQADELMRVVSGLAENAGIKVNLVPFFEKHLTQYNNQFDEELSDEVPTIVFVTGSLRRGDRVPAGVKIFIDFSKKPSTGESVVQGLAGRASGYGKGGDEIVMLSPATVSEINEMRRYFTFMGGKEMPQMRLSRTQVIDGARGKFMRRGGVEVIIDELPPHVRDALRASIRRVVGHRIQTTNGRHKKGVSTGERNQIVKVTRPPSLSREKETSDPNVRIRVPATNADKNNRPYWVFHHDNLLGGPEIIAAIEMHESQKRGQEVTLLRPGARKISHLGETVSYRAFDGYVKVETSSVDMEMRTGGVKDHSRRYEADLDEDEVTDETVNHRQKVVLINYEIKADGSILPLTITLQLSQDYDRERAPVRMPIVAVASQNSVWDMTVDDIQRTRRDSAQEV